MEKEKLSGKLESKDLEKVAGGNDVESAQREWLRCILLQSEEVVNKLKCSKCGYQETRKHRGCYMYQYYNQCPKCFQESGEHNYYLKKE